MARLKSLIWTVFTFVSITTLSASCTNIAPKGELTFDATAITQAIVDTTHVRSAATLSYLSYHGERDPVPSILIAPNQYDGPLPSVIFLHSAATDKSHFVNEAILLAEAGFVSLSIDAPDRRDTRRPFADTTTAPQRIANERKQIIEDIKRAIDFLSAQSFVDRNRISFVGLNNGAGIGASAAAEEPRIYALVLVGGVPRLSQFFQTADHPIAQRVRNGRTPANFEDFIAAIAPYDMDRQLPSVTTPHILFQIGTRDTWIPVEEVELLRTYAPDQSELRLYDDNHDMESVTVGHDRLEWLVGILSETR